MVARYPELAEFLAEVMGRRPKTKRSASLVNMLDSMIAAKGGGSAKQVRFHFGKRRVASPVSEKRMPALVGFLDHIIEMKGGGHAKQTRFHFGG